ncbi:VCBS repeat protein [Actinocorallia herbida]|uniref:VCBS repeat protein n=1 Tax=Actinocorallia herbida TaxID=58109 RepID=A0A3N1D8B1_9ACTN|nr:FG-GAP repeat protein [Actinocorallia herbida]ROO89772.1 VCBS repeat protein [Actinocorallia herbida]
MKRVIGAAAGAVLAAASLVLLSPAAQADDCDSSSLSDFDGDGHEDLVIGDPGAGVGYAAGAGQVTVVYGDGDLGKGEQAFLTAKEPQAGAGFGHALATGHLDADGCLDLVVGAPWADGGAGAAEVFYGSPDGLKPGRILKPEGASRTFGSSVAVRAAHGSHPATIAIGAPYEDVGGLASAGAVHLYSVTDRGTDPTARLITQDDEQAEGVAEAGDLFGWAVALGAIMGDRDAPDLIVSEPGEDVDGQAVDAGSFSVVEDVTAPGTAKGQHWHYGNLGIGDPSEGGRIGWSLAYAEDGTDSYVAAGVPGQTFAGKPRVGVVALLRSTGAGLAALEPAAQLTAGTPFAEAEDRYGWSVALAGPSITGGGVLLAVGVPFDGSEQTRPENGWVHLVPLADRKAAKLIDALNKKEFMPGDAGPYDRFGRAVGFTKGALLIGVPDDQENPGGAVMIKPLDGGESVELPPDSAADESDFGGAFG